MGGGQPELFAVLWRGEPDDAAFGAVAFYPKEALAVPMELGVGAFGGFIEGIDGVEAPGFFEAVGGFDPVVAAEEVGVGVAVDVGLDEPALPTGGVEGVEVAGLPGGIGCGGIEAELHAVVEDGDAAAAEEGEDVALAGVDELVDDDGVVFVAE